MAARQRCSHHYFVACQDRGGIGGGGGGGGNGGRSFLGGCAFATVSFLSCLPECRAEVLAAKRQLPVTSSNANDTFFIASALGS